MNWYEEWFGKDYMLIYPHRDIEEAVLQINFLLKKISLPQNAKILDLCCGCGRHSIELKKLGYDVVSADLSTDLINIAKSTAHDNNIDLKIIRCDMRQIPFKDQFDLIIQFFTSFGYFESDEENQIVLNSISKALKPNGKFLIDYMNPDYVIGNLISKDEKDIPEGIHVIQERWIDEKKRRINKKITLIKGGKEKNYLESVRLYSHKEIQNMLSKAGLQLSETYGDFAGEKFNKKSPRMILIGYKTS
ncbi:MAG: class I SAM-dependent methyltransferase [bacterium]